MKFETICGAAAAIVMLAAGGTIAQDAPAQTAPPAGEAPAASPTAATAWGVFSRSDTRRYLIDIGSLQRNGDEVAVSVARVATDAAAGDYTHTLDRFEVRCRASQIHVVTTTDVSADGQADEPFATDEPWEAINPRSFDAAIHEIACENSEPQQPHYPSVKAYIDAGRP